MSLSALGALVLFAAGMCFIVGTMLRMSNTPGAPITAYTPAMRLADINQTGLTDQVQRASSPSTLASTPQQQQFRSAQLGQCLTARHPVLGEFTSRIVGTIVYDELWQRVKNPSEPWMPTGNQFTAHWLGDKLIYEWKEQLFLFDQFDNLSDQDIATNFLPYAQQFGASDETAQVQFTYPPATWLITDIGKFRVASVSGTGLRLCAGAIGRFIHASAYEQRALVVEDYQSGRGGLDTAWIGYVLKWEDVTKIE
ncbi:MAG: hypothetical protein U0559_07655 [Anaerolineae bacterium]